MAETAPNYAPITSGDNRLRLELVHDEARSPTVDHAADDEAALWRSAMIGSVVGFIVLAVGITIAGTVGGIGAASALGLGVFVGAFGGAGFGFMMGASTALVRRVEPQPSAHSQGEHHDPAAR